MADDLHRVLFAGCFLIAFGPPLVFMYMVVLKRAQLVIVAITSAFFWLLSLLASALVWQCIPPLKDNHAWVVISGVLVQEALRFSLVRAYMHVEKAMVKAAGGHSIPLNDYTSSVSAGLGFGAMQAVILYGSVLASNTGTGTLFVEGCSHFPLLFLSALNAILFTVLQVILMVFAFDGYRYDNKVSVAVVFGSHMTASCITLFNTTDDGCGTSISLLLVWVMLNGLYMGYCAKKETLFSAQNGNGRYTSGQQLK